MSTRHVTVLCLCAAALLGTALLAQPPAPGPQEGHVLLANGEVIQGRVIRDGDRYFVVLKGGEIRLKASEVRAVCPDLEACYGVLESKLDRGSADEHLDLAAWCLRHELLAPAQREIVAAGQLDARHVKLPLLKQRLAAQREAQQEAQRKTENGDDDATQRSSPPPADLDDLDRLTDRLPPRVVEMFTASIQPILQNGCMTASCHGPQSASAFRLQRIPAGRPATRRLTQRNLAAALAFVDPKKPSESPLLVFPGKPHGGAKQAPFGKRDEEQYRQLYQWVVLAGRATRPPDAADDSAQPPLPGKAVLFQPSHEPPSAAANNADPSLSSHPDAEAALQAPAESEPLPLLERAVPVPGGGEKTPTAGRQSPGATGASPVPGATGKAKETPQGFVPKDPFDPEIFNRRYFGR
ncbi:MAG: hypothetical protein HYS13_06140 [Planctomycetia bacterium]|nr:hypothetical protein [Planctomycetia bacterium]